MKENASMSALWDKFYEAIRRAAKQAEAKPGQGEAMLAKHQVPEPATDTGARGEGHVARMEPAKTDTVPMEQLDDVQKTGGENQ